MSMAPNAKSWRSIRVMSSSSSLGSCWQNGESPSWPCRLTLLKMWEELWLARVLHFHRWMLGQVQCLQCGSLHHWCQEQGTGETELFISFVCQALSTKLIPSALLVVLSLFLHQLDLAAHRRSKKLKGRAAHLSVTITSALITHGHPL